MNGATAEDICHELASDFDCYFRMPATTQRASNEVKDWPTGFVVSSRMNLPIAEIRERFAPYQEYCRRHPGECDLSGDTEVEFTSAVRATVEAINWHINTETERVPDIIEYGVEEYWTYPCEGRGDCEDIALEKRRRLVALGLPRGAMRIAIGQNRQTLAGHAVLTLETTTGTYVLDSATNIVLFWYQTQYNFEARERPDGSWIRFDQTVWWY